MKSSYLLGVNSFSVEIFWIAINFLIGLQWQSWNSTVTTTDNQNDWILPDSLTRNVWFQIIVDVMDIMVNQFHTTI